MIFIHPLSYSFAIPSQWHHFIIPKGPVGMLPGSPAPWAHNPWGLALEGTENLQKSKKGLANRGLSPQYSGKIRGKSTLDNRACSELFGAESGLSRPIRAFLGPIPRHLTATGESRNSPEKARFGPIGAFRAKPSFAKPPFGFPRKKAHRLSQQKLFGNPLRT